MSPKEPLGTIALAVPWRLTGSDEPIVDATEEAADRSNIIITAQPSDTVIEDEAEDMDLDSGVSQGAPDSGDPGVTPRMPHEPSSQDLGDPMVTGNDRGTRRSHDEGGDDDRGTASRTLRQDGDSNGRCCSSDGPRYRCRVADLRVETQQDDLEVEECRRVCISKGMEPREEKTVARKGPRSPRGRRMELPEASKIS